LQLDNSLEDFTLIDTCCESWRRRSLLLSLFSSDDAVVSAEAKREKRARIEKRIVYSDWVWLLIDY
jgi:hypothetical protein